MGEAIRNARGLMGVPVTVKANTDIGTAMKFTGAAAREVDVAAAGDIVVGTLYSKPRYFPGDGTIITKYSEERVALFEGTAVPGNLVMMGTPGTGDVQRYTIFTPGTDSPELCAGICIEGATDAEGKILTN